MNDMDPLLGEAMRRVPGPLNITPSLNDVRRRVRRHNRRRVSVMAGALACTGVATTALIIKRDPGDLSAVAVPVDGGSSSPRSVTTYPATTTTVYYPELVISPRLVWDALWNARYDPSGAGLVVEPADQTAAEVMPTPEQFGCTSPACRAMFAYVVWHEVARMMGQDIGLLQPHNPGIDFSQPPRAGDVLTNGVEPVPPTLAPWELGLTDTTSSSTTTTTTIEGIPIRVVEAGSSILLIDGGAPSGAMDDAYVRVSGYNPQIAPPLSSSVEHSMVMPIADHDLIAQSVASLLGIDGFDTWSPSLVAGPTEGIAAAVVIGPDYWDRVRYAPLPTTTSSPTSTLG
jgi:hypothetical protein